MDNRRLANCYLFFFGAIKNTKNINTTEEHTNKIVIYGSSAIQKLKVAIRFSANQNDFVFSDTVRRGFFFARYENIPKKFNTAHVMTIIPHMLCRIALAGYSRYLSQQPKIKNSNIILLNIVFPFSFYCSSLR